MSPENFKYIIENHKNDIENIMNSYNPETSCLLQIKDKSVLDITINALKSSVDKSHIALELNNISKIKNIKEIYQSLSIFQCKKHFLSVF